MDRNIIETETLESLACKVIQRNNTRNRGESQVQNSVSSTATFLSEGETEEYEERAAIMEFDGGMDRASAEKAALQDIIDNRRFGND